VNGDLLSIRDLSVVFNTLAGRVQALARFSLRIRAGSTVALVGESGSGKSVTAQAVLGLLPRTAMITSGQILFADPATGLVDLAAMPWRSKHFSAIRGNRIGMVFQEPMTSFSPLHTIGDQIGEALTVHRSVTGRQRREIVIEMLRLVDFPDPAHGINSYPFELSGGLRQRAMIAMALICRPSLLIADEPTTALDVTVQAQILKLLRDLQAELGMAVLLITHDLGIVANMAEEIAVMHHGALVEAGTVHDIFKRPGHPYLKALLKAVPHFDMAPGERLQPLREIRTVPRARPAIPAIRTGDELLLEVRNLSKFFHRRRDVRWLGRQPQASIAAVKDVSFTIRRGECLGLVGESGSGKTTISRAIMRAIEPDAGSVVFHTGGRAIDLLAVDRRHVTDVRRQMQYIFQDPYSSLNPRMTIASILAEPFVIHGIGNPETRREAAAKLLEMVGLSAAHLNRYPHSFSGGQRQRIVIARALALQPEFVICDEPVSALDVSIQAQLLNLLKDLQQQNGLTYLFISHNLAVINYMADRIAVLCAGRLVELAPRGLLFERPIHPYTRSLINAVPYPDLDRPLNFDAIDAGRSSVPAEWGAPFTPVEGNEPPLIDIGGGHLVRTFAALQSPPDRHSMAMGSLARIPGSA
jgi:peptide/nickel transport system ATP-binding protein